MSKIKKSVSLILALLMLMGVFATVPLSANASTSHTQAEAVAWVQSKVGTAIDYDGYYGAQCVDLIMAYYAYLGVSPSSGNGKDYATNTLPSGWQRFQGAQPQAGDILVFNGSDSNPYGHVAIYESDYVTYHQNFNDVQKVQRITYKYNGINNTYWGVIRPDFSSATPTGYVMSESEGAGRTISDGDYWICSEIAQDYFVDIPGNNLNTEDNTNLIMNVWDNNKMPGKYDVFTFKYLNNGFYSILQKGTQMAMDVDSASLNRGTNVKLYTSYNSNAQQWSVEKSSHGYKLRSRCNNYYLDVSYADYVSATNLRVWEQNDTKSQSFALIPYAPDEKPLANGIYTIWSNISDTAYLDISGKPEIYYSDANIHIWNGGVDEKFKVEYDKDGYYKISEAVSGLAVDVESSENFLHNGQNVRLYNKAESKSQLWKIRHNSDGSYLVISKMSGYCLNSNSSTAENDANVTQWIYNGGNNQKWRFRRVLSSDMISVSDVELQNISDAVNPEISVNVDKDILIENTDYNVSITFDIAEGKGTAKITGINNYCDTVTKEFKISVEENSDLSTSEATTSESGTTEPATSEATTSESVTPEPATSEAETSESGTSESAPDDKPTPVQTKDISGWNVIGLANKTYTGKAITQNVIVTDGKEIATVKSTYTNNKKAGSATIVITGTGDYTGTIVKTFKITKAANPMKVTAKKTVTAKAAKKTTIKKAVVVKKAQGKVTYKTNNKKITVKKGTMTVAKGLKKGKTYSVKVTISAKGNTNYKSAKKTVTIKVKVK